MVINSYNSFRRLDTFSKNNTFSYNKIILDWNNTTKTTVTWKK